MSLLKVSAAQRLRVAVKAEMQFKDRTRIEALITGEVWQDDTY